MLILVLVLKDQTEVLVLVLVLAGPHAFYCTDGDLLI